MKPPNGQASGPSLAAKPAAQVTLVDDHIEGTTCRKCGCLHAPARKFRCLNCGSAELEATRVALRGTLVSFTVMHAKDDQPHGLAIVRLDAGPKITASLAIGSVPAAIGARVEGRVETAREPEPPSLKLRFSLVAPASAPALVGGAAAKASEPSS